MTERETPAELFKKWERIGRPSNFVQWTAAYLAISAKEAMAHVAPYIINLVVDDVEIEFGLKLIDEN